ncbi:Stress responsive A/B Barrel Domain [Brevundimonas vesicularis]|uniref:Stress responsive A/B Barrel Domain n=1 Tax=Brevundimonas vesicularis TaxID=41276 RepID=A0A2X1BVN8_BREVE|nr:Dabb family protein [Brevundimonas vesicularis]SPU54804.1 Stress responsive A/B Barrel Domain [Brevundimonas vesicularis]
MIYHITRFKLKPDADPAAVDAAVAQLHKMGQEIGAVRSYCVGKDIGGEYGLGALYVLDDMAGYGEYLQSPIHRKVDEIGLPLVDDMVSFDISDDADPALAEEIGQMHKARYEGDAALADLVSGLKSYAGSGTSG